MSVVAINTYVFRFSPLGPSGWVQVLEVNFLVFFAWRCGFKAWRLLRSSVYNGRTSPETNLRASASYKYGIDGDL